DVGLGDVGAEPGGLAEGRLRLRDLAQGAPGEAQVVMRLGVPGSEPNGLAVFRLRLLVSALAAQGVAQVAVRLGVRRPQPDRLAQGGFRLPGLAQAPEHRAEAEEGVGIRGGSDDLAEDRCSLLVAALGTQDVAQVVTRLAEARSEPEGRAEL